MRKSVRDPWRRKERSNEKNVYIPTWIRKDELQELDLKPEEMKVKLLK